ncbi:MAG: 23S rRNA (guanosine(2251)-2'-O)-methyltransferase RlmB [Bacteroidales bacterium]|nr:23S rRNA (guanosine(2251)-2'-O)-methyltransferase RlmB [Bacteroidales bacterium]
MATQKEIIFGIRAVTEAIQSGQELERVFFRKGLRGDLAAELLSLARNSGVPIQFVPVEKLNQFTRKNHQGVVALISPILYHTLDQLVPGLFEAGKVPLLLLLDGITDVRNFGAIARTAECAGVHGLVVPRSGSARIHEDAVKTSSGALLTVPVCRVTGLGDAVKFLKNSGIRIVAATEKASLSFYDANLKDPLAIIIGSEEKGIHPSILALCDEEVSIPLHGQIASLNVSVAASLLMYEAVRQRSS